MIASAKLTEKTIEKTNVAAAAAGVAAANYWTRGQEVVKSGKVQSTSDTEIGESWLGML